MKGVRMDRLENVYELEVYDSDKSGDEGLAESAIFGSYESAFNSKDQFLDDITDEDETITGLLKEISKGDGFYYASYGFKTERGATGTKIVRINKRAVNY